MAQETKKILVVDDEKDLRDIYALKLKNEGYEVGSASNGREALKILSADPKWDLIILDVVMPQMNGFEVLKEIKSSPKLKKLSVFMLTNLGMQSEQQEGLKLKASKYLIKTNYSPEKLVAAVSDYFFKK